MKSNLDSLNQQQQDVVLAKDGVHVVLAGPGSGKTRVICHRIAHLILEKHVSPNEIVLLTFTNKASREMKERVLSLVDAKRAHLIHMGTFHSVSAKFLRINASAIGISENFVICDEDQAVSIVKKLLINFNASQKHMMGEELLEKPKLVFQAIQKLKNSQPLKNVTETQKAIIKTLFDLYETQKKALQMLDFDDLILYAIRLFQTCPKLAERARYVLVDEDTNPLQFDWIKALCRVHGNLTVVGDPDQSIYSWRLAKPQLLDEIMKEFSHSALYKLEQNYRSTKIIVAASDAVINQDSTRPTRRLWTENEKGSKISLIKFPNVEDEALFIVSEILRLINASKGLLEFSNFAVLVRTTMLSRVLEQTFTFHSIPYTMVGELRYFESVEIKDLLAYLHLIQNPDNNVAFERVVNVPKREIGAVSIKKLLEAADKANVSAFKIVQDLIDGKNTYMVGPLRTKKLKEFVSIILKLRDLKKDNHSMDGLIDHLITTINYMEYLEKEYKDNWQTKQDNIKEFMTFAKSFSSRLTDDAAQSSDPLTSFLESISLVADNSTSERATSKVVISTLHGAKGLEWPCVFVVGTQPGLIPHHRSRSPAEIAEERRLLFVGMTRAQCFLYCLHVVRRMIPGFTPYFNTDGSGHEFTPFLSTVPKDLISNQIPTYSMEIEAMLKGLLRKQIPENFKSLPEVQFNMADLDDEEMSIDHNMTWPLHNVSRSTEAHSAVFSNSGKRGFSFSETNDQCIYKRMSFEDHDEIDLHEHQTPQKHLKENRETGSYTESRFKTDRQQFGEKRARILSKLVSNHPSSKSDVSTTTSHMRHSSATLPWPGSYSSNQPKSNSNSSHHSFPDSHTSRIVHSKPQFKPASSFTSDEDSVPLTVTNPDSIRSLISTTSSQETYHQPIDTWFDSDQFSYKSSSLILSTGRRDQNSSLDLKGNPSSGFSSRKTLGIRRPFSSQLNSTK